jgi:hypothetical protein
VNPMCESNHLRPLAPVPVVTTTTAAAIKNYIVIRDQLWAVVRESDEPPAGDVGRLRTANDALQQMLELKPGPLTPVLSPEHARIAKVRCGICQILIDRCEKEIAGRSRPGLSPREILSSLQLALRPPEDLPPGAL